MNVVAVLVALVVGVAAGFGAGYAVGDNNHPAVQKKMAHRCQPYSQFFSNSGC